MAYLVDTSVMSELVRPRPYPKVVQWVSEMSESELFLSVLTIGEIEKGIAKLSSGAKARDIQHWLDTELKKRFMGRILTISEDIASCWSRLSGKMEKQGTKLPVIDSLLAATAIVHHLTVVTRNTSDIERSGAVVFNPWGTERHY